MTFEIDEVIDELGYRRSGDLLERGVGDDGIAASRRQAWSEATERLGVAAAFFQGGVPLVYFQSLRRPPDEEVESAIADLHRQSWNHNRAPFLVVILPNEVRVLDSRTAPFDDFTLLRATTSDALSAFSYRALVSGDVTARLAERAPRRTVIDQLRGDLRRARGRLEQLALDSEVAKDLLGRSLFAQYLEDRNVLGQVIDSPLTGTFLGAVETSVDAVYSLFERVHDRFNGDVFPVSARERESVGGAHLAVVSDFLRGTRSGQLPLLNYYDFSVIPAELLSNVYEEFLDGKQKGSAAHYTPEHIVDLALEEVLPASSTLGAATVLDPACGSGIFLARAYRRLIDLRERRLERPLEPAELSQLLADSIYGCDTMRSAVRVAAFSCYLVLLDHCREADIVERVRFPTLLDRNLFVGDFFELQEALPGPYDVVATNPPWMKWSKPAETYVRSHDKPAGDKQLAHAFLWGCLDRLATSGQMVILMPAKALYNTSPNNVEFRRAFVQDAALELVVDFSSFRHELFANAVGPMALMVFGGADTASQAFVTFCTPHPTPLSSSTGRVVLAGDDIKRLPRGEASRRPEFFKTMLFGSFRDSNLFERLRRRYPTIGQLHDEDVLRVGTGYQIKGGLKLESAFLTKARRIDSEDVEPFRVLRFSKALPADTRFHRRRDELIFRGAHIVVARAIDRDGFVQAAFLGEDAVYNDSLLGIAAPGKPPEYLQALTAVLNSSLMRYLLFLSATSWGVERPRLEAQDLRALPLALPEGEDLERLAAITTNAATQGIGASDRHAVDDIVLRAYGLRESEATQVRDLLAFGVDLHYRRATSVAFHPPSDSDLDYYKSALQDQLTAALGVAVEVVVDQGEMPWTTVAVGLGDEPPAPASGYGGFAAAAQAVQEDSGTVVLRRTLRVYQPHGFVMTKPAEARHWTVSAARQDADDVIAECLRAASRDESLLALSGG